NIIRNDSLDPKWIEPVAHGVAHRIVGNDGCGFACRADAAGHSEIAARASLGSFDPDPSEHPRGRSRREPWERRFPYRQSSRGARRYCATAAQVCSGGDFRLRLDPDLAVRLDPLDLGLCAEDVLARPKDGHV